METNLIKISDAAKLLGVSTKTLRRWDDAGKLESVRTVGNHRRFRIDDLNKILGDKNGKTKIYFGRSTEDI